VTSQSDQKTRLKKMNLEQAQIFHFIKHWAEMKENGEDRPPFHIFLTGGAGTGKSFTIQ